MRIDKSILGNLSFFLMTAFFVIYNLSYYVFGTPLVIGGGATALSVFVVLLFFLHGSFQCFKKSKPLVYMFSFRGFLVGLFFFLWIFLSFFYYVFQMPSVRYYQDFFNWTTNSWFLAVSFFLVGKYIRLESKLLYKVLLVSVVFIFIVYVFNLNSFYMFKYFEQTSDAVGYQNTGRAIILFSFFVFAFRREGYIYSLIFSLFLAALLFFNAARSEFYGFIFALTALFFFNLSLVKISKVILTLILAAVFLGGAIDFDFFSNLKQYTVMLDVSDLSSSTSGSARDELKINAIQTISKNPIFGNYGSYVELNGLGYHSHNLASAWVDFGIFGFAYFVIFILAMFSDLLLSNNKRNSKVIFFALNFFCSVFLLAFAKDYTYIPFYFLLGLWLNESIRDSLTNTDRKFKPANRSIPSQPSDHK